MSDAVRAACCVLLLRAHGTACRASVSTNLPNNHTSPYLDTPCGPVAACICSMGLQRSKYKKVCLFERGEGGVRGSLDARGGGGLN